ncbi:MAG: GGDEF domain-containing protein [Lachnospiraceae bacterium]|nr:GGDEF domain-containing protein [Lachnospiraceae bacterium]
MDFANKFYKGISLRVINICLILITVIVSGIMVFFTYRLTATFLRLAAATEEHIKLEKAAHELMNASDFLTESVQRFTVNGDRRFLDDYMQEAFEANRREEAIAMMDIDERTTAAVKQLREAMSHSVELMDREYYAMRLVIEAKGYTDYPEILKDYPLMETDIDLPPEDKMRLATQIVLDDAYYDKKDMIRNSMRESLDEIDKLTHSAESEELSRLYKERNILFAAVFVQVFSIVCMVLLTSFLGVHPVLKAVDRIKADSPIPEVGANEFRYLAKAYNKMYSTYKSSVERLNFKASHDELTGAYNRAGYDLLLSGIDLDTTYMMLFDVDNFKSINDTYGHETGDNVLISLVREMKKAFRDNDYICRVGGDEFVVLMVHSGKMEKRLIESKLDHINQNLANPGDGLPPVSISVGIVHGSLATDVANLFEKTDRAMYESKKQGKNTYTFYTGKTDSKS